MHTAPKQTQAPKASTMHQVLRPMDSSLEASMPIAIPSSLMPHANPIL